ncbi:hypothetical protein M1M14_gp044 [Synechococcus phage ACG-2014e]|uniref:Uncharacterized protein n=1 Tax=Synechococcus phage ACG-2014e TaxID=1493510 RepID=A0A0E3I539_9CAUD|nr:hypothetical protein AAJ58_gp043 [Synechococcus phage ACG-2014e]YP_010355656.1 hypothetical protein M1M14_gp044 [Synechococcus phage ACG-2014e]AIX20507.1 hypothetical protein Syn7803C85_44 [Synechococcus phage ACG-2014e]AIX29723.1 hypothetical protein Syn7803US33_42 [Synechococcus phage ACG-2014e]AIX44962.1 hypothetical protein Syn7803C2_43 [Synechococcus phage ACG-2014e]
MTEDEFKQTVENLLTIQSNNDHNFNVIQRRLDSIQQQLNDLNDLKEMFRLPKPENKDRKLFEEVD